MGEGGREEGHGVLGREGGKEGRVGKKEGDSRRETRDCWGGREGSLGTWHERLGRRQVDNKVRRGREEGRGVTLGRDSSLWRRKGRWETQGIGVERKGALRHQTH